MKTAHTLLCAGDTPILIVADHASALVPEDIDLRIAPELLSNHIALDIGVAQVAALMAEHLGCTAFLGGVSRLVVDFNREENAPHLVPTASDGHAIPGNYGVDHAQRIDRFHRPYHDALARQIQAMANPFIFSLHSFTPGLASDPAQQRPWHIGVLYNQDDRGARVAIPLLEAEEGLCVGDQLPYSGVLLNATMNRHAEANGIPYLGVELRQDLIGDLAGQRAWANRMARIVSQVVAKLA